METIELISKRNSLIIKGGVLLMLVHHLFYSEASRAYYNDIVLHGYGLTNQLGIFSKVCVAIFVFASGYGLSCKYRGSFSLKKYYVSRFKKLYLNYWFIWLIFVPIGVFVFHRTFEDVYESHVVVKSVLDFLGLLNLTGQLGYNPTWWFYSCIIVLYLIYPWLNSRFERSPYLILSLAVFASFIGLLSFVKPYSCYLLPFLAGMLMERKPEFFKSIGVWELVVSLGMLFVMRNFSGEATFIVDTIICIGFAVLLYRVKLPKWLDDTMVSLGKHSMNIFLFHTFIFSFWFKEYIYITRNPFLIFLSLIIPCYLISVLIEFIKDKIGFYRLLK